MLSRHACAVMDGVIHDTYEDARDGTRCVYGYWKLRSPKPSHNYLAPDHPIRQELDRLIAKYCRAA